MGLRLAWRVQDGAVAGRADGPGSGRVITKAYCSMSGSWDERGVVMLSWISDAKGSGWHYGGWG